MEYYRQCSMERRKIQRIAWIPEGFAKVGKVLKIKIGHNWENGWTVKFVGERLPEDAVLTQERAYLQHRSVTDI